MCVASDDIQDSHEQRLGIQRCPKTLPFVDSSYITYQVMKLRPAFMHLSNV